MGRTNRKYLSSSRVFGCVKCRTHLTTVDSMISRQFNGQHGRAYLFSVVVNITEGPPVERTMTTGQHVVRDIACCKCETTLGWKYDHATEQAQKYKEGKFILERALFTDVNTPSPPETNGDDGEVRDFDVSSDASEIVVMG